MSSKTKVGKSGKSGGAKSVASFVPEPLPPVTPVPVGTDPATILFPEWSDQDVNTEKWDLPKTKDKGKPKPAPPPKKVSSLTPAQFPAENVDEPSEFVDPHLVRLPHSLSVHEWKRPSQVFVGANFIMYKESSEYPDLISGSKHLLHSDFMRSFISAIGILEYLGNTRPTPIEFASPTFFPNTSDIPWRPWHHIYSMCKAGKGQKHNPQVNQLGKYVVRLFWMGCWRKLIVDDQLPVDTTNHVLLPNLNIPAPAQTAAPADSSTSKSSLGTSRSVKKGPDPKANKSQPTRKEIEMWPFILCKALLKLSSLSQIECNELLDFDIIHCLTGWFVQKVDVTGADVLDIWKMCAAYSDHFTWPDPTKKPVGGAKSKGGKGSKSSKSSKSGKSVSNFLNEDDPRIIPYHLVAVCTDMRTHAEDLVPDISPCWSHSFLIDQTRDIPLVKPDHLPELERWKRFRWLAWAIRKGIWPAPELIPLKCFKMVSVFKKCSEHVVYKPPSKASLDIKKSVAIIEELAIKMGDGKKKGDKGTGNVKSKAGKEKKSSKSSSKDSKGKKGPVVTPTPPDPSLWVDFNKLGPHINYLYICFKASLFTTNIKITDIAQTSGDAKSKADKNKKGKGASNKTEATSQVLIWNNRLSPCRNEPIYLFMDGIDYKLIVINFAQVGHTEVLHETNVNVELTQDVERRRETTDDLQQSLNKTLYCLSSDEYVQDPFSVQEFEYTNSHPPYAYVIIEDYDWQTSKTGETMSFLSTYGTKTILINAEPGRFVLRMWIKSDTSYTLNLMSDSPVVAGTLEAVLENMSHESERLMKLCHDISSSYGQLVQKFGTSQFTSGLVTFCKSYLPDSELPKSQLLKIHSSFMQEFLNIVKEHCPAQEFRERTFALKVLFMNPTLKCDKLEIQKYNAKDIMENGVNERANNDEESQTADDLLQLKKIDRAAVTLQAFFKKLFVRKLRSLHNESHKDYMKIFDLLRRNYQNCFGIQMRMVVCSTLMRNFLFLNSDMTTFRKYYSLLKDLNSTIHLQHVTGDVYALPNSWIPITRQIFHCNSPTPVVVKICLFCGIPKYMVRVFDNDTNKEIKRFTNNTNVFSYNSNLEGYTVLCYGWTDLEEHFPWKLDFATVRVKPVSLIMVPQVTISNYILQQNYKPNVNNNICRCLVSINHDVLATFRLSLSYENVKLYFRCVNEAGQIFGEIYGTASAILPRITLNFVPVVEYSSSTITSQNSSQSKDRKVSKIKSRSVSLTRTSSKQRRKSRSVDRGKTGKFSPTESQTSQKKSKSSIISSDIVRYKDTLYILEGFIVEDSWPLIKREWDVVDEVKARSLVGPLIGPDSTSDASGSVKFKDRSRHSLGSRRKSSETRRSISQAKITDHPFWRLETVSNLDDNVVTVVDTRREAEIKTIKMNWYEIDPERYKKSKKLRRDYLESHYVKLDIPSEHSDSIKMASVTSQNYEQYNLDILAGHDSLRIISRCVSLTPPLSDNQNISRDEKSFSFESSTEKSIRTLDKPIPITEMLPPLNLEDYVLKDESELTIVRKEREIKSDKYIRTQEDEENLKLERAQKIEDFELWQIEYEEDMDKFLSEQIARNKILDIFYKGCRAESREMITDAYALREKVIDTIIAEDVAKQPPIAPAIKKSSSKKKK